MGRGILLIRVANLNPWTTLSVKNNLFLSHILCILTICRIQLLRVLCESILCKQIKRENDEDFRTRKMTEEVYVYLIYCSGPGHNFQAED